MMQNHFRAGCHFTLFIAFIDNGWIDKSRMLVVSIMSNLFDGVSILILLYNMRFWNLCFIFVRPYMVQIGILVFCVD